jgi:hypothetical protein
LLPSPSSAITIKIDHGQNVEIMLLGVGSTGECNTLVFCQGWSVGHEAATSYLLLGNSAV